MSQPLIRDAVRGDMPAVRDLLIQLMLAEGKAPDTDFDALEKTLFGDGDVTLGAFVAEVDARVVGVLLYYPGYDVLTASHGYHLADFVVDASYRRHGVGKRLFTQLAKQNLARGGEWVSLTMLDNNEAARGFYESLGMIQVGIAFFAIGERGLRKLS